jgi:hypothetical protein
MDEDSLTLSELESTHLALWRQGDYSVEPKEFVFAESRDADGTFDYNADPNISGLIVVSQTCDIVRCQPGKEYVVVAPLVEIEASKAGFILSGATPGFSPVEHPPAEYVFADLSRMMTVHKKELAGWKRQKGFSDEAKLVRFAGALERKHGRFAFPDDFAEAVIGALRDKFKKFQKKDSNNGRIVRSINHVRVQAAPTWNAPEKKIGFRFVLEDELEAGYSEISTYVKDALKAIVLPAGYSFEDPGFTLKNLDGYSARDWCTSQRIDWDYISGR